jgi:hypothetical protein
MIPKEYPKSDNILIIFSASKPEQKQRQWLTPSTLTLPIFVTAIFHADQK